MQVTVFPVATVNALRCQYCQELLSDFDSLPLTTLLNNEWTAVVIYAKRHVAFTRKGEDEANFFSENLKLPTLKTVSINIINPALFRTKIHVKIII